MPKTRAQRRIFALAVVVMLLGCAAVGCATRSPRDGLAVGQEVFVQIDDPDFVDRWPVRTRGEEDIVVLRFSGDPVAMRALRIGVLLPGGVVVGRLAVPPREQFSIALSGRPATWTIELSLAERGAAAARYRMQVTQPSTSGAGAGQSCGDALRARGIDAWIMSTPRPPSAGNLVFLGLGTMVLSASPAGAVTTASPTAEAPPVLHIRGGAALRGDFASLGCRPHLVQLNLWDTGKGKPPTMSISDPGGRRLCGDGGQPPCPSNPNPGRWVSWALSSATPIGGFALECDELYLSSIVIQ